jgi:hypothetical protein
MCARSDEAGSAPATDTNSSSSAAVSISLPVIEPNRWTTGSAPTSPADGDEQARRESVGPRRGPLLPGGDQRRCTLVWPLEVKRGGRGLRHRAERETRDYAEALGARAAQRPEQILVALLVALHHPPIGQHHLCRDHLSDVSPRLRPSRPSPPPSAWPPIPTVAPQPPGIVTSCWARAA